MIDMVPFAHTQPLPCTPILALSSHDIPNTNSITPSSTTSTSATTASSAAASAADAIAIAVTSHHPRTSLVS